MLAPGDLELYSWTNKNVRHRKHRRSILDALEMMLRAVESRDPYTGAHSRRVGAYCGILAAELGLPPDAVEECRIGGLLHDLGKIGIPDAILQKPEMLEESERMRIQTHPEVGAAIANSIPIMRTLLPFILCHHERWDGNGYPCRLCGLAIPLNGRICAVADAFDAMTSDRPYRPAQSVDYAVSELVRGRDSQFDPQCVDAFMRAIDSGLVTRAVSTF